MTMGRKNKTMSESFLTIPDVAVVPVARAAQQDIKPAAVQPRAITSVWKTFDPQITSKWAQTRTGPPGSGGALTITTRDESVMTPGFSLGNGTVVAKYLKEGRFFKVKVRFTIGSTTVINGLVLDQSFSPGEVYGETGRMHISLPFPSASSNPYFYGTFGFSDSAATGGAPVHTAQTAFQVLDLIAGGTTDMTIGALWEFDAGSPTTFSANTTFQRLWTPGDFFDVQLECETDLDD